MPTTVLVMDNNKVTRDVVDSLPHAEGGYAVIEAAGPASAVNILHAPPHRLVEILDNHLPHLDGVVMPTRAEQEAWRSLSHAVVFVTSASRGYSSRFPGAAHPLCAAARGKVVSAGRHTGGHLASRPAPRAASRPHGPAAETEPVAALYDVAHRRPGPEVC